MKTSQKFNENEKNTEQNSNASLQKSSAPIAVPTNDQAFRFHSHTSAAAEEAAKERNEKEATSYGSYEGKKYFATKVLGEGAVYSSRLFEDNKGAKVVISQPKDQYLSSYNRLDSTRFFSKKAAKAQSEEGSEVFLSDYIEGMDFKTFINQEVNNQNPDLPYFILKGIIASLLKLQELHLEHAVMHGDLNLGNIILNFKTDIKNISQPWNPAKLTTDKNIIIEATLIDFDCHKKFKEKFNVPALFKEYSDVENAKEIKVHGQNIFECIASAAQDLFNFASRLRETIKHLPNFLENSFYQAIDQKLLEIITKKADARNIKDAIHQLMNLLKQKYQQEYLQHPFQQQQYVNLMIKSFNNNKALAGNYILQQFKNSPELCNKLIGLLDVNKAIPLTIKQVNALVAANTKKKF